MRILLVEDEALITLNTQFDLEAVGHTVVGHAMTAEQAINLAEYERPDLVLMDIRLAKGDGVEAARRIHANWGIPSLFATSYAEHVATAGDAALGCLKKPYETDSLVRSLEIIEQVMNGHEPAVPPPRNFVLYRQIAAPKVPVVNFTSKLF